MKKKLFFVFLALLTVINLAAFGTLMYNKFYPNKSLTVQEDKYLKDLKDTLKLSEQQYCQMKECQCCFKDKVTGLSNDIKKQKMELIKILKDTNPDNQKINLLLTRIDSLQSTHLKEVVNTLSKHGQIMDSKQRDKFFSIILDEYSIQNNATCINKQNNKN